MSTPGADQAGEPVHRRRALSVRGATARSPIVVSGTVISTGTVEIGQWSLFSCVFSDGTGELDLYFWRSSAPSLAKGARLTIEGTVCSRAGRLVVWNPWYLLEAERGDASSLTSLVPSEPLAKKETVALGKEAVGAAARGLVESGVCSSDVEVEATGHFRVYLGAAAGVGKTVAMLDEGHRRRQRGADVVIGLVECHGRQVTQARAAGLEVVPRKTVDYKGVQLEEMDLDAILRRRPQVVLVDELAHTNVAGSGAHDKRWQDVLKLLDSGIDVVTTVNIQHLESIADAVEHITGTPVRERLPDWVVRRADQIELVDSSPEQLRRRMLHGNIYPPERVDQALSNFFRVGNLTALRELALRFLADETEEELLAYLQGHDPEAIWETTERMLVAVTAAPGTDAVIRRASRMASRVRADLHVAHVASGAGSKDEGLVALAQLTSDVGALWHELAGDDPPSVLIEFARQQQITQLVVGSSQRSRWQELISGGSVTRRLSRLAGAAGIDVHVIARREAVG